MHLRVVLVAILSAMAALFVTGVPDSPFGVSRIEASSFTPSKCDPDPKYYCTTVEYTGLLNGYRIDKDWYEGAVDGGAQQWRRDYIREWRWRNGQWEMYWSIGQGPWHYNETLGQWYSIYRNAYQYYSLAIQFGFDYYECIPGQCYHWYAGPVTHYLWL